MASVERPETLSEVRVPRLVRDEAVTPAANVAPVRLAAATEPAAPVIEPVIAFVTVRSVKNPASRRAPVAPREPVEVMLFDPIARVPPIVRDERVPTLVSEDAVTPAARVEPVSVPAGALPVMFPVRFPVKLPVPEVKKRLVEDAVVAKKLVEVAEVEVELTAVKFWRVEEPVTSSWPPIFANKMFGSK